MAFMEHDITEHQTWILIDGNNGITYLPADVEPRIVAALSIGQDATAEELALDYYDGSQVYSVELTEGYGARLSAPGYMDYTQWTVFDSMEAAYEFLRDEYPMDSEDDDSEDV